MAAVALGAGFFLLLVGSRTRSDFTEAVLLNLGSTILAIGLVSIAYDRFVREDFTREVVGLVELRGNIHEMGLLGIHGEDDLEWDKALGAQERVSIAVRDSSSVVRLWALLVPAGGPHLRQIDVIVSDPSGPVAEYAAALSGQSRDGAKDALYAARRTVESLWSTAEKEGRLKSGSSLRIRYTPERLDYEYFISDDRMIMMFDRARGKLASEKSVAMVFDTRSAGPTPWWQSQQSQSEGLTAAFDEVV